MVGGSYARLAIGDGIVVEHGEIFEFSSFIGLQRAVMPIVVVTGGRMSGLGTAVCIGPGWFLTAAHVLEGLEFEEADIRVILETDSLVGSGSSDVYGGAFRVEAVHVHPEVDLATMTVELSERALTEIRTLDLRLRLPEVGEPIAVAGYPRMARDEVIQVGSHGTSVMWDRTLAVGVGSVLGHQLERLPRPLRGSPGFETDAPAPPGSSGGPVLDASNSVIGFVSSSNAPSTDYKNWNSFVALLGPALELSVVDLVSDSGLRTSEAPARRLVDLAMADVIDVDSFDSFRIDPDTGKGHYIAASTT